jgi:hydrogenase expression/formation protein HypC
MCLAVPAKIEKKTGHNLAVVDVMGVSRTISLDLVPEAEAGDWVLMHAGFAINHIDEDHAQETLELIQSVQFSDDGKTLAGQDPIEFTGTMSGGMEANRAAAIASGAYVPETETKDTSASS